MYRIESARRGLARCFTVLLPILLAIACAPPAAAFDAFITMEEGYFFDPGTGKPFVPHGIAYQTWNRPLGVWQTPDQIDYDLDEMKKMGANSIRVDFVWQHIEEEGDNQWKWENYDYLVQAAEARGIRIFALIGYQWPPNWFPDEWYTQHPPEYDASGIYHGERWPSDIINYERPEARAQYAEWFRNVCGRYKDSKAIVGWIIGNESGYLGLWSGLLDGYDPESEAAFRLWCQKKYGNVSNLNAAWGTTTFSNFNDIVFVERYTEYGIDGAIWADMVQWREDSIASFTAVGAVAAKAADTNHLISYSTVGMQWGEENWRYHAEHRGKITEACLASNAPIDFFSVNNYPWSILGHESQQGHWGISYTKKITTTPNTPEGVPVLYSETGFTSSESMWPGMDEFRQGPLVRNSIWESLIAGANGTHIFAWHDRPYITDREKGFGILYADRSVKPAFWVSRDAFNLMKQANISGLLGGSKDPKPDIAFLWTAANHSQYNRYECEMQQIGGALERLGFAPYFMHLEDLSKHDYTNYRVLILPKNMRVDDVVPNSGGKGVLQFIIDNVIPAGVHVLASAEFPGMQNQNGLALPNYTNELKTLFGIDASDVGGYEVAPRTGNFIASNMTRVVVTFTNAIGALTNGYRCTPAVWKYNDEARVTDGTVWATFHGWRNKGFEDYHTNWIPSWYTWNEGNLVITNWFPMEGSNMLWMAGEAGIWHNFPAVPFARYTASAYLRSNPDDPLRGGARARVVIEWRDGAGDVLSTTESATLNSHTASQWVQYKADGLAPSNVITGRRVIRYDTDGDIPELLANGGLSGSGAAPTGWSAWNDGNHDPDTGTYRTASPGWQFWWDSGLWRDVTNGFKPGDSVTVGGYLRNPSWAALGGGKVGTIEVEFYNGGSLLSAVTASPPVNASSAQDTWIQSQASTTVPSGCTHARVIIRCNATGSGNFLADDISFVSTTPGGSVFVDNHHEAPAVVVKDHGTAKAAIFTFSAGDVLPDGDNDGEMDVWPWKWRYDYIGTVVKDYFGVEPIVEVTGPDAYLCLADYRTCEDGSTLWQVKNYMYDRFVTSPPGGPDLTFTITSPLFENKAIRAFERGRMISTNSNGTITLTMEPDGHEILHVFTPTTNDLVCQLGDAYSVIHPMGGDDKNTKVTVRYDTLDQTGLVLRIVFIGGAYSNAIYQSVATNVSGAGTFECFMYIPDFNTSDTNYLSTPDGGQYQMQVWLEDEEGNAVTAVAGQDVQLEWGAAPTTPVPATITKGSSTNIGVEWEELYEHLYWQHTPLARNDSFPTRIALYRSHKTQAQFPGHYAKANEVADWLESLGYSAGNPLDISFDDLQVTTGVYTDEASAVHAFLDDMESGTNGWTAEGLWHQTESDASSPTHSWAYNNGTHYNTGARTYGSLTTPWISLGSTAGATLKFKSWYETEDTGTSWDKKLVYVSTDGTNWTQLLQVSGLNRQWVPQSCDLNAYAGRSIKLRFHFDTVDGVYNQYKGWLVDDVEVVSMSGTTVDLFADDMESTTNWNGTGLWSVSNVRASSGTKSLGYNNGTDYNTGARNFGEMVSGWISLEDAVSATLSFKSWYRTEDGGTSWDRKLVYVTTDGTNWTQLAQITGPMQEWTTQVLDLASYAGQRVRLRFYFDTIDGIANNFEGWYVDDVRVSTIAEPGFNVFADAAEGGTNGWAASGLWHLAGDEYASASHAWAYNNGTDYSTGARNSGELVSPWIDLRGAESARLKFQSWYETEDTGTAWDRKLVFITVDGTNWQQLAQISGANKQWVSMSHDLGAFVGNRVRVKFSFDTIDGMYNAFRGWYVDDIAVHMTGSELLFFDSFSGGALATNWQWVAGSANWDVGGGELRLSRIGNDDNIHCAGDPAWSNYCVSANIRYNKQGPYFNDAELYVRYQDRNNFIKVHIQNFYAFWRLKFSVRVATNNLQQGWVHSFTKANRPVEGEWYNLAVDVQGTNFNVYFDGEHVGSFAPTSYPYASGRVAVGSRAVQLGIWEPQKGYYFVDDDEYSYYSPGGSTSIGSPVNLDWGYLQTFFGTLILPSVYVMNDTEAANVVAWINKGYYNIIATDGGIAMKDETGADDLGRVESAFGVAPSVTAASGLERITTRPEDHYVLQDYAAGSELAVSGAAYAWDTVTNAAATTLALADDGEDAVPAVICNSVGPDPYSQAKVAVFNFGVDTAGQLTNGCAQLARRVFEWARGQAYRVVLQLKYPNPLGNANFDIEIMSVTNWALGGTGQTNFNVQIPSNGIMTGDNLYWAMYVYPWASTAPWADNAGFFTTANDGMSVSIPGKGLQILGGTDPSYAGRAWGLWLAYNTRGEDMDLVVGLKDEGQVEDEQYFATTNLDGWTVNPSSNFQWSATNGNLRCDSASAGGYSILMRDGVELSDSNITIEYDVKFEEGATGGGLVYRGNVLYCNPQGIWWSSDDPLDFQSQSNFSGIVTNDDGSISYIITGSIFIYIGPDGLSTGEWHHVMVNIRDGDPYMQSDIYVDGVPQLLSQPLPGTNFTSDSYGFVSPYTNGYCLWDNVRVSDEVYSFATTNVNGEFVETDPDTPLFWANVPDYDPEMWEHEGSTLGGRYEWYAFFEGGEGESRRDATIYYAPVLKVWDENFPTGMAQGETVYVPVEWENLPEVPAKLYVSLEDPYLGTTYVSRVFTITNATGSMDCEISVPVSAPAHDNYLWAVYAYATNLSGAQAFEGRFGLDDNFRFGPDAPVIWYPQETPVRVTAIPVQSQEWQVFSDSGFPPGYDAGTWQGSSAVNNGEYTGVSVPEGVECWYSSCANWHGFGIYLVSGIEDLSAFSNGFLTFWLRSSHTTKVEIQDQRGKIHYTYGKGTVYVSSTADQWKKIVIPLSTFGTTPQLTNMWYAFQITEETAGTFYVDDIRWVKGVTTLYSDEGIAEDTAIQTWAGGDATFNGNYSAVTPPEGAMSFYTGTTNWAGWGSFASSGSLDMSLYSNGLLTFWVRSTAELKVELEDASGGGATNYIPSTGDVWYEFVLPIADFDISLTNVSALFKISAEEATTFLVDNVRWLNSTSQVPVEVGQTFYSDAGLAAGTDVLVWWASQYWAHVSTTINDGGLEDSTSGTFPDSGYWALAVAPGATSQCSTSAARTGTKGLRASTGSAGSADWSVTYQEYPAYPGDVFLGGGYARQPGGSWVAGSEAFVEVEFLDAWSQSLTSYVSTATVTSDGQAWTTCTVASATAPAATRAVRVGAVLEKPNGDSGVSAADFDDLYLLQGNSFYGEFAEDPTTPEGSKCFRSYCVAWSGWGIFYTNSVVDLRQYSNGYLKFWYKSSGYTKIELQSINGGVTNTAMGAYYGPTTNQSGTVEWSYKVIPITNFTGVAGVDLQYIKSPFMVTDPTYDRAFYVDNVRWVKP